MFSLFLTSLEVSIELWLEDIKIALHFVVWLQFSFLFIGWVLAGQAQIRNDNLLCLRCWDCSKAFIRRTVCHRHWMLYSSLFLLLLDCVASCLTCIKSTLKKLLSNSITCFRHLELDEWFIGSLRDLVSLAKRWNISCSDASEFSNTISGTFYSRNLRFIVIC